MAMKNRKKGLKRIEDQAIEFSRKLYWGVKVRAFPWKMRGSWKDLPPRRHPGWAAYHANKGKDAD